MIDKEKLIRKLELEKSSLPFRIANYKNLEDMSVKSKFKKSLLRGLPFYGIALASFFFFPSVVTLLATYIAPFVGSAIVHKVFDKDKKVEDSTGRKLSNRKILEKYVRGEMNVLVRNTKNRVLDKTIEKIRNHDLDTINIDCYNQNEITKSIDETIEDLCCREVLLSNFSKSTKTYFSDTFGYSEYVGLMVATLFVLPHFLMPFVAPLLAISLFPSALGISLTAFTVGILAGSLYALWDYKNEKDKEYVFNQFNRDFCRDSVAPFTDEPYEKRYGKFCRNQDSLVEKLSDLKLLREGIKIRKITNESLIPQGEKSLVSVYQKDLPKVFQKVKNYKNNTTK